MITAKKVTPEKQARRFFLKKKWGKAIVEYQKLLRQDDTNLQVVNLIGDAYYLKNNPEEAFMQYRKALASYEDEGLFDNAIAVAKKILRLNPSDNDIHLKLAELYTDQAFLADALLHLTTYLSLVGKRLDEKTVRSIYQKIGSTPNENPHLWDEITESYRRLNINDPELDRIMAPGGMSPAPQITPNQPESIPTSYETPLPEQETIESVSQPVISEAHKTHPDSSGLTSEPPLDFPKEELPLQDHDLTAELKPLDENISDTDKDQSVLYPSPEETKDSEIESDLLGQEDSSSIDLQLANILREVLPPEKESVVANTPSSQELSREEPFRESEPEKPSMDSFRAASEPDQDSSLTSDLSSEQEELPEENEPEPDIIDRTVDAPVSLADDGHFGMDSLNNLPKVDKEPTESGEDEPLWTIPFEVDEERVPEEVQTEEVPTEKAHEHQAVESMLTGYSGDAESPSTSDAVAEEMPTLPGVAPIQTIKPTLPQSNIPTDEPPVSGSKKEETDIPDQTGLKTDLHSLELSELAEMKREESVILPSFDGKEHYDMGKVYKEMLLWDAAIAELKTSAMDPRWRAKSCILLADCFRQKGEVVLAISQLKWALSSGEELKEDSDKYNLHFELGIMYETAGNYAEAKEQYQAVHRWNPSHRGVEKKLLELRKKMQST